MLTTAQYVKCARRGATQRQTLRRFKHIRDSKRETIFDRFAKGVIALIPFGARDGNVQKFPARELMVDRHV